MILADTLSRAYIPDSKSDESYMDVEVEHHVNSVLHSLPVSTDKLGGIREETSRDPTMISLLKVIREGWPQYRQHTPVEIHDYWNYRDEISEVHGVIMKGDRIIIPTALRGEMLLRIHESHMGIEKCRRRARDVIFWPRMNEQISDLISKCDICQEFQSSNQKEPMMESPLPRRPWEMVATDLFQWEHKDYLVVVDYYSRYVEIAKLDDTKSRTIVNHTKSIFARHGIPSIVRSDNGPQYIAQEYKQFAKDWKFEHQTSSPYYPKSNGLAEKAVQTVKALLSKSKADGKDPYLSLLEYRNTPIDDVGSPSQLLMSRRLQSILPTTLKQLQRQIVDAKLVEMKLKKKQENQKKFYDIGSRVLPPVNEGERVRVQVRDRWKEATVEEKLSSPRSYKVRTPTGQVIRRNRVHIRKRDDPLETEHVIEDQLIPLGAVKPNESSELNESSEPLKESTQEYRTRSGRVSKPPERLQVGS